MDLAPVESGHRALCRSWIVVLDEAVIKSFRLIATLVQAKELG